jgi:hypothetical protein
MPCTPGPWSMYQSAEHAAGWGWIINARNGEDFICEVSSNGQTMVELVANARLIAAAPEMLAALERIAELGIDANCGLNEVHAAIRTAKGEL